MQLVKRNVFWKIVFNLTNHKCRPGLDRRSVANDLPRDYDPLKLFFLTIFFLIINGSDYTISFFTNNIFKEFF